MSNPDVELITKLAEAFDEHADAMPRQHLLAALAWFAAYTKAKIEQLEASEANRDRND